MSLLEMLSQQLGDDAVRQISRQVGADHEATASVVSGALPMMVTALARNSSSGDGASALTRALDLDHDGSILDDIGGFLGQGDTSMGDGILGHVLGSSRNQTESALGKMSGLDAATVSKVLALLAPLVMGALGRHRQDQGLDTSGLAEMLGGERRRAEKKAPEAMGILGQLLDADGDGQVGDDLAKMGMGLLGSLLGGKR